jgi:hypothetical protein
MASKITKTDVSYSVINDTVGALITITLGEGHIPRILFFDLEELKQTVEELTAILNTTKNKVESYNKRLNNA